MVVEFGIKRLDRNLDLLEF